MSSVSTKTKKDKRYTGPSLYVWEAEKQQPSAADILFGDAGKKSPVQTREEKRPDNRNRSAADVLFGAPESQSPVRTVEERIGKLKKPSAAEVLVGDMFPQKPPEQEPGSKYPTLNFEQETQEPQQTKMQKTLHTFAEKLQEGKPVGKPDSQSSSAGLAQQQEMEKQAAKPVTQSAQAANRPVAQKQQGQVANAKLEENKVALAVEEKKPEEPKPAARQPKEKSSGGVGSWIYPIPEYARDKHNPNLSIYNPWASTLNILGAFSAFDSGFLEDVGYSVTAASMTPAAQKNMLTKMAAKVAKLGGRAIGTELIPVVEILNAAITIDAERGVPYSQKVIDKLPESIGELKEKYTKLENEKITFLEKLEGYAKGEIKDYKLPNHYLYFDGKELAKTEEGRKYFELMKNLPGSEIDSNGYLSVYRDDFAQGMLNGEDWVGFAKEHMEFSPGRAAEMQAKQNSIQKLEAELEGQTRTKEDYFQAMLEYVWPKDQLQKDLTIQILNIAPENPYDAWKIMYDNARYKKDADKIHALEALEDKIRELSKSTDNKPD